MSRDSKGAQHPWHTTLVQSLVCYTLPEAYTFLKCKSPMPNTLTVRTWDLVLPRPSRVLVTNPDRQLPCWFSKTVLRTPSIGERPVVHIAIVCGFFRVRPIQGRALFFYYASSFSARSIRYPTPTWVWIRCGASGYRSNFLRRDAM